MFQSDPYIVIAGFFAGVLFWWFFCYFVGRAIARRREAEPETETAPKGHFAELRESVERASRGF